MQYFIAIRDIVFSWQLDGCDKHVDVARVLVPSVHTLARRQSRVWYCDTAIGLLVNWRDWIR